MDGLLMRQSVRLWRLDMAKRWLGMGAAGLLAWSGSVWWFTGMYYENRVRAELQSAGAQADRYLTDIVQGGERVVSTRIGMQRVMARNPFLKGVLLRRFPVAPGASLPYDQRKKLWSEERDLAQASQLLREDARTLGLSSSVILDSSGNCIAAGGLDSSSGDIGINHADREFFPEVMAGRSGYRLTASRASGVAGMAFYTPIMDDERILGSLVSRIDLTLYGNWLSMNDSFLTDRNGIIVLTRDDSLAMRALIHGDARQPDGNVLQARYGQRYFKALEVQSWGDSDYPELRRVEGRAFPVLHRFQAISAGAEPVVHILWPFPELEELREERTHVAVSAMFAGILVFALVAVARIRRHERRASHALLATREREFRTLAEASPDMIVRYDEDGRFSYVNPTFERTLGRPLSLLRGKRPMEVPGLPEARLFQEKVLAVARGAAGEELEHPVETAGGDRVWHLVSFVPERDENGKVRSVLAVSRNITQLKRVESELRESRRRFAEAERISHVGSWEIDHRRHTQYWSAELYRIYEIDPVLGKVSDEACLAVTHPDDRDLVDRRFRASLATGEPFQSEYRLLFPDGRVKYVYERSESFFAEDGTLLRTTGMIQDISVRRNMEEALLRSEREFRSLAENVPDGILRFERNGKIRYVNPQAARAMQIDPSDYIGRHYADVEMGFPQDADFEAALHRALTQGENSTVEITLPVAGGEHRLEEVRLIAERDERGAVSGALVVGRDVTELRRYENELRGKNEFLARHREQLEALVAERTAELVDSERRFRSLAENAPDNIIRYDAECRVVYANPRVERTLGISLADVIGRRPTEIVPAERRHIEFEMRLRTVLEGGKETDLELLVPTPDGEVRHHYVRFVAEYDQDGHPTGILAIGRDMTEARQMERQLRMLVSNIPDYISHFDAAGCLTYLNPAAVDGLQLDAEAIMGLPVGEIVGEEHEFARGIRRVLEKRATVAQEGLWKTAQGKRYFEVRDIPEFDHEGNLVGVLSIGRDITERKEAEEALVVREREFRTLADNLPDCVIRYDRSGRATYFNAAMAEANGDTIKPLGKHPSMLPGIPPEYGATLDRVLASGVPGEFEMPMPAGMNGAGVANIRFVAERNGDGSIVGALAIGRDVTELKQKECEIKASHDQIRRLAARQESAREEERRHIARELHDELGQQLTALRLNVNVVDMRFGKQLPELHGAIADLLQKVDRTIQVARNVATSLRPATLDLGLLAGLDWLVSEFRKNTVIACGLKCADELPELGEEQSIVLFRIVQEALTNVVRHSGAQCVDVLLTAEPGSLILEVIDDGRGFDTKKTNPRKFGLVGMRERVLAIDGVIYIQSEPGQGTRVWVRIPVTNNEVAQ